MPDDVRACEPALREMLMGKLSRGKVDVRINLQRGEQSIGAGALNQTALGQLAELERSVLDAFRASAACAPVKSCAGPACWPKRRVRGRDARRGARVRQGSDRRAGRGALARRRATRDDACRTSPKWRRSSRAHHAAVPELIAQHQQKLVERLQEALGLAAPEGSATIVTREEAAERIRQEVTMYGIRIDIAEELARLAHLNETRHMSSRRAAASASASTS
jgi:uncharacterized protein YicC (UPF0701 family)